MKREFIYVSIIYELIKFIAMLGIVVGFVEDSFRTFITWTIILIVSIAIKETIK